MSYFSGGYNFCYKVPRVDATSTPVDRNTELGENRATRKAPAQDILRETGTGGGDERKEA
eukprot:9397055-Pyramimonas_sp.AAC.1